MILRVIGHKFHYEMENLCRVFYPLEKIRVLHDFTDSTEWAVTTEIKQNQPGFVFVCLPLEEEELSLCTKVEPLNADSMETASERCMAQLLFRALVQKTGYQPPWGILTGVRPSKLMLKLNAQYGNEAAATYFREQLFVQEDKIHLTQTVAQEEKNSIERCASRSFSLYIAIPFCPSRCSYCSFVSHSITGQNAKRLIPDYIKNLCEELRVIGGIVRDLGLECQSVYMGGGTPTVLSAKELEQILGTVQNNFAFTPDIEYTVEAGRPDTVTIEKLETLHRFGVNRISINPQTFDDDVLSQIGRLHTAQEAVDAFRIARNYGFSCINMDVIAGLPGDTPQGFAHTMQTALSLQPENITVHTLALKRASRLMTAREEIRAADETANMLHIAKEALMQNSFRPYYMYRQSRCVGNLENVGWCAGDTACAYNIYMMEECHTVLAAGAGAVTKLKEPNGESLERLFNFKFPYEYNSRFSELLTRKKRINAFYQSY